MPPANKYQFIIVFFGKSAHNGAKQSKGKAEGKKWAPAEEHISFFILCIYPNEIVRNVKMHL